LIFVQEPPVRSYATADDRDQFITLSVQLYVITMCRVTQRVA